MTKWLKGIKSLNLDLKTCTALRMRREINIKIDSGEISLKDEN
jgi:hypothetical protein